MPVNSNFYVPTKLTQGKSKMTDLCAINDDINLYTPKYIETDVLQSLCVLYLDLLKGNATDMADAIENTMLVCEEITRGRNGMTQEYEDIFAQFYILRKFRRLNKKQQDLLISEMENIRDA